MGTTQKKVFRWLVIIAAPIILFPLLVVVVLRVIMLVSHEPYEPEPMEVIDLGGDFYVMRWPRTESSIDCLSDETDDDPLLGITPAYLIGDVDGEQFDTRILYTTIDALRDSDLGASQAFRELFDEATSPESGARYTHFTSDVLAPPLCVGVDTELGCVVIFFFEFGAGLTCEERTEAALAHEINVWPRDSVDMGE